MAKFAVLDGNNVINTIIADSKEIAEQITNKTCIEFTIEPAEVGGTYSNGIFIPREREVIVVPEIEPVVITE